MSISVADNDSEATFWLGCYNEYGNGTEKDEQKAFFYYLKSAEMGHAKGTFQVGCCYANGLGVEKNVQKAFAYYQKSANMNNVEGVLYVGNCYQRGIGVEKDEYKAFINYLKAAKMGNVIAIFNVGYCYENGVGVAKDEQEAFINYSRSADMGYVEGMFNTGCCYKDGFGVDKNEQRAFDYYLKAANMENAKGLFNVGYFYENGIGVDKNERKAFEYYKKAANLNHLKGIYILGNCYQNGIGAERNIKRAIYWYKKGKDIENNNVDVQKISEKLSKFVISDELSENSNFEIEKVINHGNSAIVFEATEKDTKKSYAIKKSLPNPICGNYFFHNEIKIMKLITPHLNCVKFFDHWEYNKHIVLQIELCDGTLLDLIYGGNISISNVWHILLDIGFGIEHIHRQNVVHLDLKPENILVSNNRFKIGDFGLALRLPVDTDDPELHVGDRKYVALEVLEDNIISKPADVFSFGMIILHIISTGDLPNRGDNWLKIRNGDLSQFTFKVDSQDLINLTKGMIKKEIKERQTIKEIIIHIIKFIYEQI